MGADVCGWLFREDESVVLLSVAWMEGLLRELWRPRRQQIHKLLVIISDQIICFPKIKENLTSYDVMKAPTEHLSDVPMAKKGASRRRMVFWRGRRLCQGSAGGAGPGTVCGRGARAVCLAPPQGKGPVLYNKFCSEVPGVSVPGTLPEPSAASGNILSLGHGSQGAASV